ncbi:MAG: copper chaperone PCu(A)C [Tepidamorphaceae bacterium]
MSGHTFTRCRAGGLLCAVAMLFSLAAMPLSANAAGHMLGELQIDKPWTRATPGGAKVAGGYVTITNKGSEADRLVAVRADFSGDPQLHEMSMNDGVMIMRPVEGGIEIPAGETVELKPGGLHIMFMGLLEQLNKDETRKVTLVFEKAGEIELDFPVAPIGAKEPPTMDHSGHNMSN